MQRKNFKSHSPCVSCGKEGEGLTCYHHLTTKGANITLLNEPWNLISVCQGCHNLFHSKGISFMAAKAPAVKIWLEDHGWFFCDTAKKWRQSEILTNKELE